MRPAQPRAQPRVRLQLVAATREGEGARLSPQLQVGEAGDELEGEDAREGAPCVSASQCRAVG